MLHAGSVREQSKAFYSIQSAISEDWGKIKGEHGLGIEPRTPSSSNQSMHTTGLTNTMGFCWTCGVGFLVGFGKI